MSDIVADLRSANKRRWPTREQCAAEIERLRKADDDGYGGSVIATTVKCLEEAEAEIERLLHAGHSELADEAAHEIERLRDLLREARGNMAWRPSIKPLLARIDAALSTAPKAPDGAKESAGQPDECPTCGRSTKRHPGYVIGNHWLESAYERICAGEAEDDVLADYDVVRVTNQPAARTDLHAAACRYWSADPCTCGAADPTDAAP